MLSITAVSHSFNGAPAIADVSLTVQPGEIVAVVGPSGCGKSTLLRIAASLLSPDVGDVHTSGARLGYIFQEPALLPWLRVRDNATLLADAPSDAPFVDSLLERAGLAEHRDKWPHELSGGMKMRLSLVRTMAARPSVLLADEPFGALDQITRHQLHDELLALHSTQPFAMVLVTHAIDEAVYLADRVLTMSPAPGRITATTTVPFARPRHAGLRYDANFAAVCGKVAASLTAAGA
jgi:NitT/TauT family transport system ATP-binding protein